MPIRELRGIFLGKKIFLKTLNTEKLPDSAALQRFKREAKILAQLDHPHIIRVFDFGGWKNYFYISFEYFESRNLRSFIKQGSLDELRKEALVGQLCRALAYAHKRGVVHRDLKPENILINEQLQVKVADFGLAILKGDTGITEASSVVGTPAYMSPEQISGKMLSPKSDLFSLGVIIFELFSGKHLFLGADAGQTLNNILNVKNDYLNEQLQPLAEHIRSLLSGLLQKDPADRFGSADQALEFLPGEKNKNIPARRRHKLKLSLAMALALLLFLAVFFYPRKVAHKEMPVLLPDTVAAQQKMQAQKKDTAKAALQEVKVKPEKKNKEKSMVTSVSGKSEKKLSYGKLWVECLPWANLTIDSVRRETTPLAAALTLQSGRHQLLSHPAYPSYTVTLFIDSGKTTIIKMNLDTLMGYLQCNIHPWGDVYLDGKYLGQSPFRKPFKLLPGKHTLRIQNKRFAPYEKEIFLTRKDTLHLRVNLVTKHQ